LEPHYKAKPRNELYFKFHETIILKKEKNLETHKPITRFSGEQVIIAQLQGSTESSSQLLNTPCGSCKASLILIKASTVKNNKKSQQL
jgi:hypothetical protein